MFLSPLKFALGPLLSSVERQDNHSALTSVKIQMKPQTAIAGYLHILPARKERSLLYTQNFFLFFEKINIKIPES